jgi:hypothetical protein
MFSSPPGRRESEITAAAGKKGLGLAVILSILEDLFQIVINTGVDDGYRRW